MRILIEGHQPLRGTYRVSGNSNSAMALIAAAMLADTPVTLTNVPNSASVGVMLDVGASLGMAITRNDGEQHAPPNPQPLSPTQAEGKGGKNGIGFEGDDTVINRKGGEVTLS